MTSFPRLLLIAGLLWAATPRTSGPFQAFVAPGQTRPLLRKALGQSGPLPRKAAATWVPEGYWASAHAGQLRPEDFMQQHIGNNIPEVIKAHLTLMLQRAVGGFRTALDFAQDSDLRLPSPPPSPKSIPLAKTYTFKAEGDPMIVIYGKDRRVIHRHHYLGPAVTLFFDESGRLDHIDFVGVCDARGSSRQSPWADYVGEHARLYVQTGKWRYRDGCSKRIAEVSDCDWASEKPERWQPDVEFLNAFKGSKTFVLHACQPRVIEGPPFGELWSMATAPELFELDFDRSVANAWVNAMLVVVGSAQTRGLKQDAKEVLRYAVMYGMAMTHAGQDLLVPAPR